MQFNAYETQVMPLGNVGRDDFTERLSVTLILNLSKRRVNYTLCEHYDYF